MPVNESFLAERVDNLFGTAFDSRNGQKVPATEDVKLKDGAVKIEATFLFADLEGSAYLSKTCPWTTTAKIIRAFLDTSTRLITKHGGHIRSFDGDRVMGVFYGKAKNNNATTCGREIHWTTRKVISVKAQKKFRSISDNSIEIRSCCGIDTGDIRAVRSGIRDNNDLIWIGKPASFAAKLSDVREIGYHTYISKRVYAQINGKRKFDDDGADRWSSRSFQFAGDTETVYATNHWKRP